MIISYRGPWILYFIYRLVRCINRVCLPNIIMDKDIVPELLQADADKNKIADCIDKILNNEKYKFEMINSLKNVKQKLSTECAYKKSAEIIANSI